jgi:hypothetical protein
MQIENFPISTDGIFCFKQLDGENIAVDINMTNLWFKWLPRMLGEYKAPDIYNADKTGFSYNRLADLTLEMKGQTSHGGARAKETDGTMQGKESNSRLTFCTSFILLFQHGNI